MTNSRTKGTRGELELAKLLGELFKRACRRAQQYCGVGSGDVQGLPGVHVECKRVSRLSAKLDKALAQAAADAKDGDVPTVWHRDDRGEWRLTVEAKHVPVLVERLYLIMCSEE